MAFKTAAELFGDGGVFGVQVPIDIGAPAGPYNITNRGIGFGEQLSSAIANRTHYALGLNDNDLNTRLSIFETGGLNAAYRGGAAAVPGIGAAITLDGKAISTTSALAAMYALDQSNAHLRADMLLDVAKVGTGLEVRGRGLAGVMHLTQIDSLTGSSTFAGVNLAAVLNPGGGLPTTVRITGQAPHTAGATDLVLEYDFALITTLGVSKLCIIGGLGGVNTDLTLKNVDGTGPVFLANAVATVTLYRAHFGSFTGLATRAGLRSVLASSGLRAVTPTVMDLVGGNSTTDPTMTENVLRILRRESDGSITNMFQDTSLGRTSRTAAVTGFSAAAAASAGVDTALVLDDIEDDPVFADETSYFTLDWHRGRRGNFAGGGYGRHLQVKTSRLATGVAGTFFSADEIDFTVSVAPFQTFWYPLGATIVQIIGASNPAALGYYLLDAHDEPNDRIRIRSLTSATAAVSFIGVTCTMTLHPMSELSIQNPADLIALGINLGVLSNSADYQFLGSAIRYATMHRPADAFVIRDSDFEIWSGSSTGPEGIRKLLSMPAGTSLPANLLVATGLKVGTEIYSGSSLGTGFRHMDSVTGFSATPTVVHSIGFANALPDYFGGALEWSYLGRTTGSPGLLTSSANGALVAFPIRLPHNAAVVSVAVTLQQGSTRVLSANRTTVRLYVNDIDNNFTTQIGASAVAVNNTSVQAVPVVTAFTVDSSDDEYFVVVTAGTDGGHAHDTVTGVRVTFQDPGPRNF